MNITVQSLFSQLKLNSQVVFNKNIILYNVLLKTRGIGKQKAKLVAYKLGFSILTIKHESQLLLNRFQQNYFEILNFLDQTCSLRGSPLLLNMRANISNLKLLKSYRGFRHLNGLPVRGQRTRTNRKTVLAGRSPTLKKEQAATLKKNRSKKKKN